ncbi:MAG: hypothetical protein V2J55_01960 [Candidatus Competibacteraceae bacterium]|nr:hypothetical protein [Candidatus Competibacteraceae bacterium]
MTAQRPSSVAFRHYRGMLRHAERLLPADRDIVLLVDRGFTHVALIDWVHGQTRWHLRLRLKRAGLTAWICRRGRYRRLAI